MSKSRTKVLVERQADPTRKLLEKRVLAQRGQRLHQKLRCFSAFGPALVTGEPEAEVFAAAYSVVDLIRLCAEVGLRKPTHNDVEKYWRKGPVWGSTMKGLIPERGVWVSVLHDGAQRTPPTRIRNPFDLGALCNQPKETIMPEEKDPRVIPYACENCDSTDYRATAAECTLCEAAWLREALIALRSTLLSIQPFREGAKEDADAKAAINCREEVVR